MPSSIIEMDERRLADASPAIEDEQLVFPVGEVGAEPVGLCDSVDHYVHDNIIACIVSVGRLRHVTRSVIS